MCSTDRYPTIIWLTSYAQDNPCVARAVSRVRREASCELFFYSQRRIAHEVISTRWKVL